MPKNPADDCSYEQLREKYAELIRTLFRIDELRNRKNQLEIEIMGERERLKEQGYDVDNLNIVVDGIKTKK